MSWGNRNADVSIKRGTEEELKQAISDLQARGYELVSEPKAIVSGGYEKGTYDYKYQRNASASFNAATFWFVKMRRKTS